MIGSKRRRGLEENEEQLKILEKQKSFENVFKKRRLVEKEEQKKILEKAERCQSKEKAELFKGDSMFTILIFAYTDHMSNLLCDLELYVYPTSQVAYLNWLLLK